MNEMTHQKIVSIVEDYIKEVISSHSDDDLSSNNKQIATSMYKEVNVCIDEAFKNIAKKMLNS